MHEKFYEGRTQHFFKTTIGMAKTKHVSLPRLKPNGWILIVQSILQVGVNSADSAEFSGPVEYLKCKQMLTFQISHIETPASPKFTFLHLLIFVMPHLSHHVL